MTRPLVITLALAPLLATAACMSTVYEPAPPPPPPPALEPAPGPPVAAEVSFFSDPLAPYGSWVAVAGYGQVWVPRVAAWWRPYSEGHWVYSDAGWTWVGTEPWGWAAYHYGRWYWDAEYGWAWVPGTVWAPAWVAWRSGGGHIGWAPLPPSVRWEAGIGFSAGGVDFAAVIAPQHWCFVEERYITAPAVREYIVPPARNVTYVNVTNNITNYTVINNRVVNNSVTVAHVEQVTGRPVERFHIVDRDSAANLHTQALQANEIPMVRRVVTPVAATGTASAAGSAAHPATGTGQTLHTQPGVGVPPGPAVSAGSSTQTTKVETVEDVRRRQDLENKELQLRHDNERVKLQAIHQTETTQPPTNLTADQLKNRHLAEQQALDAEHRSEVDLLAKRHERELATVTKAKTSPTPKPTPKPKPKRTEGGDSNQH